MERCLTNASDPIPQIIRSDEAAGSGDLVASNVARVTALFPEIAADGKVDLEVLRELLGDIVEDREERYGLNWKGKRKARAFALTPSLGTLRPTPKSSVDWDTTQNIVVEGDNLETLKLLRRSYAGKVKLVYIDPPYNTGNDFVYPDNYKDSIGHYLSMTGQVGEGGEALSSANEEGGRFHTSWLNMMYPRIMLAKEFLRNDGVIVVSCNDKEVANLKLLMDELIGEEGFVGQLIWQRSKKGDAKLIATVHEYMLCYVRDKVSVLENGIWRKPKEGAGEVLSHYDQVRERLKGNHAAIRSEMTGWYRDMPETDPRKAHKHYSWSDDRGLYFAADFAGPDDGRASRPRHDIIHPQTGRPVKKPSTGWRWDETKTKWALEQDPPRIHFGADETTIPTRKSYLAEIASEPFSSVFYRDGRSATLEVENLVGKGVFPFPKNTEVLAEIIELVTGDGHLVMDFFAGSGSTGHAVIKLNAERSEQRRFIMVQLPEPTDLNEFEHIALITEERLRKAGKVIKDRFAEKQIDIGFRVYKLATSNLKPWQPDAEDLEASIFDAVDNVMPGRTEEDLLVELLLKTGIDLTLPQETHSIVGRTVHALGGGTLMVCLGNVGADDAEALGQGMADWVVELDPVQTTVYFKDTGLGTDGNRAATKANLAAILRQRLGERIAKIASI